MLPFYSLLEHPHRACADQSRPSFSPARRVSLQHTNQHIQHAQSKHAQQRLFDQTCGSQQQLTNNGQIDTQRSDRQQQEEEKEQLDSLDQLLAYPAAPRSHSEEEIKSERHSTT